MSEYAVERSLKASAEDAWAVISDLAAYADAAPGLRAVERLDGPERGEGARRRCITDRGPGWIERCVAWNEGRGYSMETEEVGSGLSFARLLSVFSVEPRGAEVAIGVRLEYDTRFWLFGPVADALYVRKNIASFANGLVDHWVERVRERQRAYKATVATVLRRKGNRVITVLPDDRIVDAAGVLAENRIGCVIVATAPDQVEGLVSERDIVRAISERGVGVLQEPVSDIMTRKLFVCAPDHDMFFAMACMTDRRIRHLPVMDKDTLVGIISIGDVVKERIFALETESETMREYIAAREWRHLAGSDPDNALFLDPIGS